jgi:DNA-binding transcriptional MerR regulator
MFKTKQALAANGSEVQAYSSADVARLSGVSLRQLQWWDEQKVVSPRHDGHKRIYDMAEVVEVSVIAELRRKGFSLQKIRRVLRFLQKEMGKRLADILAPESDIHLLTDGKHIYLEEDHARIVDVLKNAKQAMFVVSVSDQVRRLTATPRKPVRSETSVGARKAKAV